jgi:heme-degrading monooxygenase HmoA
MADPQHHVVINTFTLKPGQTDAFVAAQQDGLATMRGRIAGLLGSRMHRALDGDTVVLVSVFESTQAFEHFRDSGLFAVHRQRIAPFIEKTSPAAFSTVYAYGTV